MAKRKVESCLSWGPGEGATAEEMEVKVGDSFAAIGAIIDDEAVAGFV